jgi:hypothetical protein
MGHTALATSTYAAFTSDQSMTRRWTVLLPVMHLAHESVTCRLHPSASPWGLDREAGNLGSERGYSRRLTPRIPILTLHHHRLVKKRSGWHFPAKGGKMMTTRTSPADYSVLTSWCRYGETESYIHLTDKAYFALLSTHDRKSPLSWQKS